MSRFALIAACLFLSISTAQAGSTNLHCQGQELGVGDESNAGPVSISVHNEGLELKWENSDSYLMAEGISCGVALPAGTACSVSQSERGALNFEQVCGNGIANGRGAPVYPYHAKLVMSAAKDHGRFSCVARGRGANFVIELSGCR